MNITKFNELQQVHSTKVVYQERVDYVFILNKELLMNMNDEEKEEYNRIEFHLFNEYEDGIYWNVMCDVDHITNYVSVKELSDFDKVNGLEDFVVKYIGQ